MSAQGSNEHIKHHAGVAAMVHDCNLQRGSIWDDVDGW